jgi:hypothetical protein
MSQHTPNYLQHQQYHSDEPPELRVGEQAIQDSIQLYKIGIYSSSERAGVALSAAPSSVRHLINGRVSLTKARESQQALNNSQEASIVRYLLEAASWGFPIRPGHLSEMSTKLSGRSLNKN